MRTRLVVSCALLMACPPAPGGDTDGGPTTTPATTTSTTAVATSSTTGTSTAPTTSGPAPTSTTGDPCPVGAAGCACTAGGACDPGLVCEAGTCAEGCAVGSLGCPCTGGGGCDAGLTCDAGECVEGVSPPCSTEQAMDDCCGDGWLDEFEECDIFNGNGDAKPCTPKCKLAVCGDGLVLENVEACDGGDNCTTECTFTTCGNGTVEPYEWCEPRGVDDLECTHLCLDERKIIFVSSEHYRGGEIGGVEGGDAKCQALADAAGLVGKFKAWLATSEDDAPLLRFSWFQGPYVDVNGDLMAETWSEIYSFSNPAPLITEHGVEASDSEIEWLWKEPVITRLIAWASALGGPGGPAVDPAHCGGWADVAESGGVALLDPNPEVYMSGTFKVSWGGPPCDLAAPIVCVEQ